MLGIWKKEGMVKNWLGPELGEMNWDKRADLSVRKGLKVQIARSKKACCCCC